MAAICLQHVLPSPYMQIEEFSDMQLFSCLDLCWRSDLPHVQLPIVCLCIKKTVSNLRAGRGAERRSRCHTSGGVGMGRCFTVEALQQKLRVNERQCKCSRRRHLKLLLRSPALPAPHHHPPPARIAHQSPSRFPPSSNDQLWFAHRTSRRRLAEAAAI